MTEQRVIATKPKIGARPTAAPAPEPAEDEGTKKKGKGRLLVVLLVLLLAGGAAYWFLLKPADGGETASAEPPPPEPGEVLVVEPISLNLAGGHYLRIGLGLQLTADAGSHGTPDTARALDIAVVLFSGRPVQEVSSAEGREALRTEMLAMLHEAYHGEVMGVYFTDYVTQ